MNLLEYLLQQNNINYTITNKQVTLTPTKKLFGIIRRKCLSGNAYRQIIEIKQKNGPFSITTECSYGTTDKNPQVVINGKELKKPYDILMAIVDDTTFATTPPHNQSGTPNIESFYPKEISVITKSIYEQYLSQK